MSCRLLKVLWIHGVSVLTLISAWNVPTLCRRRLTHRQAAFPTLLHHASATSSHNEFEESARSIATNVLQSVLVRENGTQVERALKVALRVMNDGKMRKRVSQLVLGTTVMQKRHEYVYNVTRHLDLEKIRYMVNLHAEYLNSTCEDRRNFVTWPSDTVERIAVQYSMPTFLVKSWVDEYGEVETEMLCTISNRPGPIRLRRNAIRCSSDTELILRLEADEGVTLSPLYINTVSDCLEIISNRPKSIWAMSAWKDGWFEVQDAGSQLIIAATQLHANDKVVVDYCAGNGGKTLAIISKLYELNNNATVWAHDVKEMRLAQLRGSLSRVGVPSNKTSIQVLTTSCAESDFYDEMADLVLVDAPCSSSGVLRRRPSHRWELTQETMEHDLPRLQLEILKNASLLVKPGGRLIYATCSLCHCENEHVAASWERNESFAALWEPWVFHCSETWPIESEPHLPGHYCKLVPHRHNTDGFFIARWKRRSQE